MGFFQYYSDPKHFFTALICHLFCYVFVTLVSNGGFNEPGRFWAALVLTFIIGYLLLGKGH